VAKVGTLTPTWWIDLHDAPCSRELDDHSDAGHRMHWNQYEMAQVEGTSKVDLLFGGGGGVIGGHCPIRPAADCPVFAEAAASGEQLLAQMARDGIENVGWFYNPRPTDAVLSARTDVLRPLLQDV